MYIRKVQHSVSSQESGRISLENEVNNKFRVLLTKNGLAALIFVTIILELVMNHSHVNAGHNLYYNGSMSHSSSVVAARIIILCVALAAMLYVDTNNKVVTSESMVLAATVVFFALVMVAANSLVILYICIEGLGLLSFVLASERKTPTSVESGLKYFFQSSFASIIMVAGIALLFAGSGDFKLTAIRLALAAEQGPSLMLQLGSAMMILALLFKMAAFPGHFWVVDVYHGPSQFVLTFFAVVIKAAITLTAINVFVNIV